MFTLAGSVTITSVVQRVTIIISECVGNLYLDNATNIFFIYKYRCKSIKDEGFLESEEMLI